MTPYQKPKLYKRVLRRVILQDQVFKGVEPLTSLFFRQEIARLRAKNDLKLHLGCGPSVLPGWINIDMEIYPGVLAQKLPRGLKRFGTSSVRYIYSSHFMEHLDYPGDAVEFARQCLRILVPGGVLRIVVPDIEPILRAYVADNQKFFKIQAEMHPAGCTTKLDHLMYALQQDGQHKYGYDFETMKKTLALAGFKKIYKSGYNTSPVEALRVEYRSALDEKGEPLDLYVEAVKV